MMIYADSCMHIAHYYVYDHNGPMVHTLKFIFTVRGSAINGKVCSISNIDIFFHFIQLSITSVVVSILQLLLFCMYSTSYHM